MGVWDEAVEDERGLFVRERIMDWSAEGGFARALARAGALDGLSIGFRSREARRDGRLRVQVEVELWEVSLVTFPMLPGRGSPAPLLHAKIAATPHDDSSVIRQSRGLGYQD